MKTEYRLTAKLLDSMDLAFCVFDADDRTVLWNDTFLRYFPEHQGHVHHGEHYGENLRRFYRGRLPDSEMHAIERYVAEGVERNRTQTRAYVFQHHGRWFRASSLPEPGGGRLRIWLHLAVSDAEMLRDLPPETLQSTAAADANAGAGAPLHNLGEGATVMDAEHRVVAANAQFLQTYRIASEGAAVGRTLWEIASGLWDAGGDARQRALVADDLETLRHHDAYRPGSAIELPLPGQRWIRVTIHATAGGRMYALHWDISAGKRHEMEKRRAERRARESEQRIRDVFTHSGMPTLLASPDGRLIDGNDALCDLLGYRRCELGALRLEDCIEPGVAASLLAGLPPGTDTGDGAQPAAASRVFDRETVFRREDGGTGACQFFCAAVFDGENDRHHIVAHLLDITRRKREEQARERMVDALKLEVALDELTGLINRRQLEAELQALLRGDGRHGLLFIDLDGFKLVNDRAGHAFGDVVLRQVASLIKRTVRGSDVVGRLGGDEFVVLLRDCEGERVRAVAANLVKVVGRHEFGTGDRLYRIGASVGIRVFGDARETLEAVLRDADAACYRAKANGRNRVEAHG